jgi:purine-nucleoside phosphorylase
LVCAAWDDSEMPLIIGASWTTDAPFRGTEAMVAACRADGILAVEMEAAALYALAAAQQRDIICFAHVTNQMGQATEDFEKGIARGVTPRCK